MHVDLVGAVDARWPNASAFLANLDGVCVGVGRGVSGGNAEHVSDLGGCGDAVVDRQWIVVTRQVEVRDMGFRDGRSHARRAVVVHFDTGAKGLRVLHIDFQRALAGCPARFQFRVDLRDGRVFPHPLHTHFEVVEIQRLSRSLAQFVPQPPGLEPVVAGDGHFR